VNLLLLSRPANRFNLTASKRIDRLREKTRQVEDEVQWMQYKAQKSQHQHVLSLLQRAPGPDTMLPLPFRDLPYPRNNDFQARHAVLEEMSIALSPDRHQNELQTVSLFGLGGIGKTQIALEFAYRHATSYDAIFWFNGESDVKMREQCRAYSLAMQSQNDDASQKDALLIKTFHEWLRRGKQNNGMISTYLLMLLSDMLTSCRSWSWSCPMALAL